VATFGHLRQLTDKANRLRGQAGRVAAALPEALRAHVQLATITDGCLVLKAASAAWATQARFKTPEILARLREQPEFAGLRSIRIRTDLDPPAAEAPSPGLAAPGSAARDALLAQAADTSDPRLRAALERLARRARAPRGERGD